MSDSPITIKRPKPPAQSTSDPAYVPLLKPIRSKIPARYHQTIYEWYHLGKTHQQITDDLQSKYNLTVKPSTLQSLLRKMKQRHNEYVKPILLQELAEDELDSFRELSALAQQLKSVAQSAHATNDLSTYLRTVDRLTKIHQIRLQVRNLTDDATTHSTESDLASTIIAKLNLTNQGNN